MQKYTEAESRANEFIQIAMPRREQYFCRRQKYTEAGSNANKPGAVRPHPFLIIGIWMWPFKSPCSRFYKTGERKYKTGAQGHAGKVECLHQGGRVVQKK